MITQNDAEEAIEYLASTDDLFGQLKGRARAMEYRIKIVEAQGYLDATGAVELRKSTARASDAYKQAVSDYEDAVADMTTIEAKRATAMARFELFRSVNSARKSGGF